jgi:hypothetical protein
MDSIPESKFGLRDIIALVIFIIAFGVCLRFIPDQTWLTESTVNLLIIRLVISTVLSSLCWFVSLKMLIPSDEELIDLDVKRRIAGGMREIRQDASQIKTIGYDLPSPYSQHVIALGETIERIVKNLDDPNLPEITKIEGKLFRFVHLLKTFKAYKTGEKRTTEVKYAELTKTFDEGLALTIQAMDNLEFNMSDPNLSHAQAVARTLEDLYQMDGLLGTKAERERKERIAQKSLHE